MRLRLKKSINYLIQLEAKPNYNYIMINSSNLSYNIRGWWLTQLYSITINDIWFDKVYSVGEMEIEQIDCTVPLT